MAACGEVTVWIKDTDKNEDRFDADVALSTGLLGPLIDSLIEALGGEMELGAAAASEDPPF